MIQTLPRSSYEKTQTHQKVNGPDPAWYLKKRPKKKNLIMKTLKELSQLIGQLIYCVSFFRLFYDLTQALISQLQKLRYQQFLKK